MYSNDDGMFQAMINVVIGSVCLVFLVAFVYVPTVTKQSEIQAKLVKLEDKKEKYGIKKFPEEKLEGVEREKAKVLYADYEKVEDKARTLGIFSNKENILDEIKDNKKEIESNLVK